MHFKYKEQDVACSFAKEIKELYHGSYRPETFLFKYFLRTFQGQITFFQGLFFH